MRNIFLFITSLILIFSIYGCKKINNNWHTYKNENSKIINSQKYDIKVVSHSWKIIDENAKNDKYQWGFKVTIHIDNKDNNRTKKYYLGIKQITYILYDKDGFKLTEIISNLDNYDDERVVWDSGEMGSVLQEVGSTKTYRDVGFIKKELIQRATIGRCKVLLD